LVPRDRDFPERVWRLECLARVLDGTLYDVLDQAFHEEKTSGGEYVPIRNRRPSVRYALCSTVVSDAVSLLFSEGHFPAPDCGDEKGNETLARIIKESALNWTMVAAATRGAIGSVAISLRVLKERVFFEVVDSVYLTPEFDPQAPDMLLSVTQRYKVAGSVLRDRGYKIADDKLATPHWFQRVWDANAETWFVPWPASSAEKHKPVADTARTVRHALGFVPMVWVKNLPGGTSTGDNVDGACTFGHAIDTSIEIDYQLSQVGRGLKYSSDPTLMIREPAMADGQMIKGAGNALIVSTDGDAKLLEISGSAATAVIEYVRCLRELALESLHGNRANADKVSAAQSGRAMELMNQGLIWLADRLRVSYGEGAMIDLLGMVQRISAKMALKFRDGSTVPAIPTTTPLRLRWPRWYQPTADDRFTMAQALAALTSAGIMSREAAVEVIADDYDIEDVPAELTKIDGDMQAAADREITMVKATKPANTLQGPK
jgi:hypothetical protein